MRRSLQSTALAKSQGCAPVVTTADAWPPAAPAAAQRAWSQLSRAHQKFASRYLNGHCDALAIALAVYSGHPIRALWPVYVMAQGDRQIGRDFLHTYLVDRTGAAWDARGWRPEAHLRAEYGEFLQVLRRPGDLSMEVQERTFETAYDFVRATGCNTGGAIQALDAATAPLHLDIAIVERTRAELSKCTSWRTCKPQFA